MGTGGLATDGHTTFDPGDGRWDDARDAPLGPACELVKRYAPRLRPAQDPPGYGAGAPDIGGRTPSAPPRGVPPCAWAATARDAPAATSRSFTSALLAALALCACDPPGPAPSASPTPASPAPARFEARPSSDASPPELAAGPSSSPSEPVPAFDRPYASAFAPGASASVGTTRNGYLVGGAPLPAAGPLAARPIATQRGAIYATRPLVLALTRAAHAVARRWPGSVLWAGDASAASGGPLAGHASHASGRDVDLAFYVRAPDGALADSPDLARVGPGLATSAGTRFDVARNWALIDALLRDPSIDVQWVFVAAPLRAALLDHARSSGADPASLARAEVVLAQPRDSSAHAEHFHLRIHCAAQDRLDGCLDAPPVRPWARRHDEAFDRLVDGLLPFLDAPWSDELAWAVTRLVRMNAVRALPALERRMSDPDPRVALLATDAADFLSGRRTPSAWARWRIDEGAVGD